MRKKIMLLMAVIPLIFMLAIFSVSKVAGIYIPVPVSGIAIRVSGGGDVSIEGKNVFLNLATYSDDLYITADVLPAEAGNKRFSYEITSADDPDRSPDALNIDGDGRVTVEPSADTVGKYKVRVKSNESVFTDSVLVDVDSSLPVDLVPSMKDKDGDAVPLTAGENSDYEATIAGGSYYLGASVAPANLSQYAAEWTSGDEDAVDVNPVTGRMTARFSGKTEIAASVPGPGGNIRKTILLNVRKPDTLTVNGIPGGTVRAEKGAERVSFFAETAGGTLEIPGGTVESLGENRYRVSIPVELLKTDRDPYCVAGKADGEDVFIDVSFTDFVFDLSVSRPEGGEASSGAEDVILRKEGTTAVFAAESETWGEGVSYSWTVTDGASMEVRGEDGSVAAVSPLPGGVDTKVSVRAMKDGKQLGETVERTVRTVKALKSVNFKAAAENWGIADRLALGDTVLTESGGYKLSYPVLDAIFRDPDGNDVPFSGAKDVLRLSSDDEDTAVPVITGNAIKLNIKKTGTVRISAEWKHNAYFGENVRADVSVTAVKGGVSVGTYGELRRAAGDGRPVVLTNDIMLGKKGATGEELESFAQTMPTTWDWGFYKNRDNARPSVKYLIEFKNDVYGNGHGVNGGYITKARDTTGKPLLFKGPLDFVSIQYAAVKGQDNVVFLVRKKGVRIDNVVLSGCSDEDLLDGDGNYNLSELNYVGTTLEISSDAVLTNSRVRNGRTTVRIFGGGAGQDGNPVIDNGGSFEGIGDKVDVAKERIKVRIESCILEHAREFIVKIGSNRAVLSSGDGDTFTVPELPSPYRIGILAGEDEDKRPIYKYPDAGDYNERVKGDADFYDRYVLTDVTIKNSVLATSGLFSVGMETHFSGPALDSQFLKFENWENLSATSFPSVLRLEGNVRLWDWKVFDNIDSSTLIEVAGEATEKYDFLKLDISQMLEKVTEVNPDRYGTVISSEGGKRYVHGGIAFYGGGNNYSFLDDTLMTSEKLNRYDINLHILSEGETDEDSSVFGQGTTLPMAAGYADFRFFMYGNDSDTDYDSQVSAMEDGSAYDVTPALRED